MFFLKRLFTQRKSILERYKFKSRKLGSGSFGSVHLGKRRSDRKSVAIKIIPIKHKEDCAREIKILRMLPTHANVCGFIDSFEDENNIYIVLEHINGQNLYEYLESHLGKNLMTIPFLLEILQQCLQGIAAIHAAGIFHRDIKLENFMITFDRECNPLIKLIDFGLSDIIGAVGQKCIGSAFWMSPEVIWEGKSGNLISEKADIWSFGMIMLELFCGNPMFSELTQFDQLRTVAALSSPPIPQKLMDDTTALGIWFRSLATMCLQIKPDLRPTAETLVVLSKTCSISAAQMGDSH
jgi:serine/threonine protein kinase